MNATSTYNSIVIVLAALSLLLMTVAAAPMESEDDQSENVLVGRADNTDVDMSAPWDPITAATLRKLLVQLEAEDRLARVGRSWPQAESRGWGLRALDGRIARQWRADKRQVRFRQCYFNPISCFRK